MTDCRKVLLVQLPIPPAGPTEIVGNVPLAAGYLTLLARQRGLESDYDIQIFPPTLANSLSDCGVVEAILERQPWLLMSSGSQTGGQIRKWLRDRGLKVEPAMEPDDFDLIVHLVALGLGLSLVPRRAITAFPRRKLLQRIPLPEEFRRTLVVIAPRSGNQPPHVQDFVRNILFS